MKHSIADFTKIIKHCNSVGDLSQVKQAYRCLKEDYNSLEQKVISSRIDIKLNKLKE